MNIPVAKTNENNVKHDLLAKVLIVGDSAVGKTCLLLRFAENKFQFRHMTTIGLDFKMRTVDSLGKKIKMQIWDTAGQEKFRTITQTYFKGAMGIVLVYACNNRESFKNVETWIKQINESASDKVCKIIIGNKCDAEDRAVSFEEGKKLAKSYGLDFFEASAKDDINVEESFMCLSQKITEEFIFRRPSLDPIPPIIIKPPTSTFDWLKGCCS